MNISQTDRKLICEWAAKHPEILKVILYGSRARGDNRPDSDIDLAIVMRHSSDSASGYGTWFYWYREYKQNPDLLLSNEVHLEWYECGAGLERVGPGVEQDGILLYKQNGS